MSGWMHQSIDCRFSGGNVRFYGEIKNTPKVVCDKIKPLLGGLFFCYEAGPCGLSINWQLIELSRDCLEVATSLIAKKACK